MLTNMVNGIHPHQPYYNLTKTTDFYNHKDHYTHFEINTHLAQLISHPNGINENFEINGLMDYVDS